MCVASNRATLCLLTPLLACLLCVGCGGGGGGGGGGWGVDRSQNSCPTDL